MILTKKGWIWEEFKGRFEDTLEYADKHHI